MSIKGKIFLSINIVLIASVLICNYFYLSLVDTSLQAVCSGLFVAIGFTNLLYAVICREKNIKFNILVVVALVCAFIADMTIDGNFVFGVIFFAVEHICFYFSYCMLERMSRVDLMISAIVLFCGGSIIVYSPFLEVPDVIMQNAGLVYAAIISLMTGKAISNFIRIKNPLTLTVLIGSVVFFFSDIMLVFDQFLGGGRSFAFIACISLYYPAQCLLALSSFFSVGSGLSSNMIKDTGIYDSDYRHYNLEQS